MHQQQVTTERLIAVNNGWRTFSRGLKGVGTQRPTNASVNTGYLKQINTGLKRLMFLHQPGNDTSLISFSERRLGVFTVSVLCDLETVYTEPIATEVRRACSEAPTHGLKPWTHPCVRVQ